MHGKDDHRFPFSLALAGLLLASPVLAGEPIEERVVIEAAGFETAGYEIKLVGLLTDDEAPEIVFKTRNTGAARLDRVRIEIEEWNEAGWLEAASSHVLWAAIDPGEERLFTRPLQLPIEGRAGVYVVRRDAEWEGPGALPPSGRNDLARTFPISTCANYCDRCSDKAGARFLGGVQEVSCTCDDSGASCQYSCYPPPG